MWAVAMAMALPDIYAQQLVPDSLFGNASGLQVNAGANDEGTGFLWQADGKIIYGGYDYDISQNDYHIDMVRFDNCGMIDPDFGTDGIVRTKFDQRSLANSFALQTDQKILAGGQQAPSNAGSQQIPVICRFNTDGTADMTFNGTGFNALRYDNVSSGSFNSVYVMNDNRILCIGTCSGNANGGVNGIGIMRFMADGTLDASFDGDGKMIYSGATFTAFGKVYGHLMPDGRIVAVAGVHDGSFIDYFYAMAFDPDGNSDPTYGSGGSYTDTVQLEIYNNPLGTAMQTDGKVLIAANRTSGSGIEVLRLTTDGMPDSGFGMDGHAWLVFPGVKASGIKVLSDGKILVMGGMNTGFGVGCGILLNSDGTVDTGFGDNGLMIFDLNNNSGTHYLTNLLEVAPDHWIAGGSSNDLLMRKYTDMSNVPHISYNGLQLMSTGMGDFQWYLDGNMIPGATTNPYIPVQNGAYTVEITDAFGCMAMSDTLDVSNVGIAEKGTDRVSVAPNPFFGDLTVQTERTGNAEIVIYDSYARPVLMESFSRKATLNTLELPDGLYLYVIRSDGRVIASGKLIRRE